jgi:hypothetical protein
MEYNYLDIKVCVCNSSITYVVKDKDKNGKKFWTQKQHQMFKPHSSRQSCSVSREGPIIVDTRTKLKPI